jgi:hypothetical protein
MIIQRRLALTFIHQIITIKKSDFRSHVFILKTKNQKKKKCTMFTRGGLYEAQNKSRTNVTIMHTHTHTGFFDYTTKDTDNEETDI